MPIKKSNSAGKDRKSHKKIAAAPKKTSALAEPSRDGNESVSPTPRHSPSSIVGIGASAGGLEAFEQLLRALPGNTGMAFVLVQHLAPTHQSMLSELLGKATRMPVIEVTDGLAVLPNRVYVIPPNAEMSILD